MRPGFFHAHHVIHKPGVFWHPQFPLDVVVCWSHNHIGGHLRNEAADLHPDAGNALGCGNVRAVHGQTQRSAVAADSLFQKPHHVRVIQRFGKFPQLNVHRDAEEELGNDKAAAYNFLPPDPQSHLPSVRSCCPCENLSAY